MQGWGRHILSELEKETFKVRGSNHFADDSIPESSPGRKKAKVGSVSSLYCPDARTTLTKYPTQLCNHSRPSFHWFRVFVPVEDGISISASPWRRFTTRCALFSVHSLSTYLVSSYYVPGIFLGTRDTAKIFKNVLEINQTKSTCPHAAHIHWVRQTVNK